MPGSRQARPGSCLGLPCVRVWGRSSPHHGELAIGRHPGRGTPPPLASPLSAGSAIFSPSLTLFLFPLLSRIMSLPL